MDNGAHFYRCDFQVHSPRDWQWKGRHHTKDDDRRAYAKKFIVACREQGLSSVAITDHHDLCFFKYFRDAAANEKMFDGSDVPAKDQIIVFPGIELTLSIPCQAIIILDPKLSENDLKLVLTALAIKPSPDDAERTAEIKRLGPITTFNLLKEQLDYHDNLKNRYIILPNVTSGGGDTLLRKGQANKYSAMPCVGGYLDGSIDKCTLGDLNVLNGKAREWGSKRVAFFQTSDSRSEDHAQLGKFSTWVKWSEPTAEALRQACLAQESRISQTDPQLPAVIIKSICVSDSKFLGKFNLTINPQYTALIGSRGTGKSTILEYLRWALCDEYQHEENEDSQSFGFRQRKLIENTLKKHDAIVEVQFAINGVPHMVQRKSESGEVSVKIAQDELKMCTPEEVRMLLPIQAYSQKQLSRVGVRMDELNQFVRSGIKTELDSISENANLLKSKISQIYSNVRRQKNIVTSMQKDDLSLKSLTQQAQTIRESLTDLSKEQQALIIKQPLYLNASLLVNGWREEAKTVSTSIERLNTTLRLFPAEIKENLKQLPEISILENLQSAIKAQGDSLRALLKNADATIRNIVTPEGEFTKECKSQYDRWKVAESKFNQRYSDAKAVTSLHATKLKSLEELERKIREISKRIDRSNKELESLGTPEKEFLELREQWIDLHRRRGNLYEEQCSELTKLSSGAIRANVLKGKNIKNIEGLLKSITKGSGIRTQKLDDFLEVMLNNENPIEAWNDALEELATLSYHTPEESGDTDTPESPYLLKSGFLKSDLIKIASKLTPELWLELVLTPMEDKTVFDYQTKQNEYISFENASAGQQATALLSTLLNQSGPPLIIDQPEDDLDNQIMSDIVECLWDAKKRRQIIFSSHNANLVVNGDAELVVCCEYCIARDFSKGRIASEGAIDIPETRNSIKKVMEGGEEAFMLRLEKYGF